MEQFSLEKWLQNKSRKVVTGDGRPVRIICWDAKVDIRQKDYHIIALIDNGSHGEDISYFNEQGVEFFKREELFFADEEEELTEFEKEVAEAYEWAKTTEREDFVNEFAPKLLDLAKKELEKENSEFKPKFTYNEKDYSELANKLIEFRNNTPLCSVSYRDGEGRKVILHYEKEILDLARKELLEEFRCIEGLWDAKKVIEWLMNNINNYLVKGRDIDLIYEDLRKAMEEGINYAIKEKS